MGHHGERASDVPPTLRRATQEQFFLAEGPTWDPVRRRLLWVDILEGRVLSGVIENDGTIDIVERIDVPDVAGAVAVSASGELVVAGTDRLQVRRGAGAFHPGPAVFELDGRRFNDGKPDPAGRLVVGTKGPTEREMLCRFEIDGSTTVLDDDLQLSNGLSWTRNGRLFYSVDTGTQRIYRRAYDPVTGAVGERQTFIDIDDGFPDGITTDAADHLWVAMWGAGRVARFDPDGRLVEILSVPAPHVSSVAFAGDALDIIVITTAREGMSERQLLDYPNSGCLFTMRSAVPGNSPYLWNGSSNPDHLSKENQ